MKADVVVVVGSGIAGLTAAAILAKKGRQVVIVEKEPRMGGAIKQFRRNKISFDVGFHYTGCLGEGEILQLLWQYCDILPELSIIPLSASGHDNLYVKGFDQPVHAYYSYERLSSELKEHFPTQSSAINSYFSMMQKICETIPFYNTSIPLTSFLHGYKSRPQSLADYLEKITDNPYLQAVLAAPAFLYGVPVRQASLEVHAMVAHGYYSGAYTVAGGGQAVVDTFMAVLRENGVQFLPGQAVESILVDNEKVIGVRTSMEELITCRYVIYTGHPAAVIDMVPPSVFRPAYRTRLQQLKNSLSMFAVFGRRTDISDTQSLELINYFHIPSGLDVLPKSAATPPHKRALMMTRTRGRNDHSLSQDGKGIILLRPAYWQDVELFHNSSKGNRPYSYSLFKEKICNEMLYVAEELWGELCGTIRPLAVGTPLTFRDELTSPQGGAYGAMHCLGQFNPDIRTRLPGLLLSGQSTLMTGVVGASLSGMVSAGEVLGLEPLWEEVRQCH